MAFIATDMALLASCVINGERKNFWAYGTDDSAATVVGDNYFAEFGSTSGNSALSAGDIIFAYVDMATDSPDFSMMAVTDHADGTAVQVSGAFNTSKVGVADVEQPD